MPGPSGTGKSTLVAALAMSGFGYLSDELAVVRMDSAGLLPFFKPICLKRGGWQVLKAEFGAATTLLHAYRADGEAVRYVAAPEPADSGVTPPVRFVILPSRSSGVRARVMPCSRSKALVELARNSLNLPRHGALGVETLARVVEESDCYDLRYDDLRGAVEAIIGDGRGEGCEPSSFDGRVPSSAVSAFGLGTSDAGCAAESFPRRGHGAPGAKGTCQIGATPTELSGSRLWISRPVRGWLPSAIRA